MTTVTIDSGTSREIAAADAQRVQLVIENAGPGAVILNTTQIVGRQIPEIAADFFGEVQEKAITPDQLTAMLNEARQHAGESRHVRAGEQMLGPGDTTRTKIGFTGTVFARLAGGDSASVTVLPI